MSDVVYAWRLEIGIEVGGRDRCWEVSEGIEVEKGEGRGAGRIDCSVVRYIATATRSLFLLLPLLAPRVHPCLPRQRDNPAQLGPSKRGHRLPTTPP
jgi:hypothetical protein